MRKINDVYDCVWVNGFYYVISAKDGITMCDSNFNIIKKINDTNDFKMLTYNDNNNNFYLCKDNKLYKSNDLKKFNLIDFNLSNGCLDKIIGITYCKCFNSILITTKKSIFMLNLKNNHLKKIYSLKEEIIEINDCMDPLGCRNRCKVSLITAICCSDDIYVAYIIDGVSYISKLIDGKIEEAIYHIYGVIKSMFLFHNEIWILVDKDCHQELVYTCIDCNCDCKSSKECKHSIIESIALIETSLAKILNSEGEKIQAAIKKTDNIDDLLCINTSVKDVIYYVTILEFILVEKLKLAECKDDCGCCKCVK